jgi:acetyl esterase/lipase
MQRAVKMQHSAALNALSPDPGVETLRSTPTPSAQATLRRTALLITGLAAMLSAWLEFWFVRHEALLGALLALTLAGTGLLVHLRGVGRLARAVTGVAVVGVVARLAWFLSGWYPLWVLAQGAAVMLAFGCFLQVWLLRRRDPVTGARRVARGASRVAGGLAALVAAVVSAVVVLTSITPAPLTAALQSALGYGNSFEPDGAPMRTTMTPTGALRISDIRYGEDHPNSYLDVYIADGDRTVDRPTYVYVHGGGFIVGGKASGDPAAGPNGAFDIISGPMLEAGYNVVSVGYALAPGAAYPTPVIQLSQAVAFLQDHGADYGIDMDQVVVAGASAGGQIIGQFANIETNPAYAKQVGVAPVMHGNLKAAVLDSAALDADRLSRSQTPVASAEWLYTLAGRAYLGHDEARRNEANVIDHVTADFPAAFIADGNTATFPDQARDLHSSWTSSASRTCSTSTRAPTQLSGTGSWPHRHAGPTTTTTGRLTSSTECSDSSPAAPPSSAAPSALTRNVRAGGSGAREAGRPHRHPFSG